MLFDECEYYNIYQLTVLEFHIRLGLNSFYLMSYLFH